MRRSVGLEPACASASASSEELSRIDAETLYRAHASFVLKFLYRMGGRREELDDLVQQVFLVAHDRGGYVRGTAQPTTWLACIAVRVLSTQRRTARRKRWNELAAAEEILEEVAEEGVDAHRHAEARQSLERVSRALEKLPEDQRLLFVLHEIEERSCESLARELDLPLGTVHSRLFSARRAFVEAHQKEAKLVTSRVDGPRTKGEKP